ncbi:MAG TPA: TIGR01777 family oxidoreductase [Candidatus Acidoferrales bacterium]|nr:TIGR01777 family oxidoreductase [Candidatus Acidoferrales bacterium]
MISKRIVIAGGSGFIGSTLAREFSARGSQVVVLTRSPRRRTDGVLELEWDGSAAGPWASLLDGADGLINLAGRNINCPHTPDNLREITASRVNSVKALAAALALVNTPPRVWVQASAVGFYGDTGSVARDESAPAGDDALARVCQQWEAAFASAHLASTRKVTLRIGTVLGRGSGALPLLRKLTRWFLGGPAGSGRQYLSWIHLADLAAMFQAAVEDDRFSGVFNSVAPNAVPNAQFMRELRRVLRRPWCPPAPGFVVKAGARLLGSDASLVLASQRCVPRRFLEAGFQFRFGDLALALKDLCRQCA